VGSLEPVRILDSHIKPLRILDSRIEPSRNVLVDHLDEFLAGPDDFAILVPLCPRVLANRAFPMATVQQTKSLLFDPVEDVVELFETRLMFLLQIRDPLVTVSLQANTLYLHKAVLFYEG
jgi:hypothetical protein